MRRERPAAYGSMWLCVSSSPPDSLCSTETEIFCPENLSERRAYFKGEGRGGAGGPWERCCRRLRGSTLALNFSMGLRPRLSAAAASAALLEPPGWRFGDRCCRRLRGSTFELPLFHGLTPTAKCCRRLRGSTGTPGLAPRDDPIYSVAPTQLRRLGQEYSPRRCPGDHLFENRCAHGGWWFWRGSGCRARQLVPGDAAASRWVDQLEDAVRVLANNPFTFQSKVLTKNSSN